MIKYKGPRDDDEAATASVMSGRIIRYGVNRSALSEMVGFTTIKEYTMKQ